MCLIKSGSFSIKKNWFIPKKITWFHILLLYNFIENDYMKYLYIKKILHIY